MLIPCSIFAQYDRFGGWIKIQGKKTGFFHAQKINNRWWLVTPEGNVFFAKGVESVDMGADRNNPPADKDKYLKDLAAQLKSWNFNTAGNQRIKLPEMPYSVNLGLASSSTPDMWVLGIVPDFFSPEFIAGVDKRASELCPALSKDPWLIGYYTDNEIRWVPDIRSKESVLEAFLKKDPNSEGYKRAMVFLKEQGRTPETMTFDDMAAFLEIAAAQYGRVVSAAIHKYDPNHLILGSRFNSRAPLQLTRGLAPYYDVFSFNNYEHRAPIYKLGEITRISGKPTLITEFSFKAMDSGLYNTIGAGDAVLTQQNRADLFTNYVQDLAKLPSCLGFYWFRYRDQPKEGAGTRSPGGWGGENSNYGLVKIDGTPWTTLVLQMKKINASIEEIAAEAHMDVPPGTQMAQYQGGSIAMLNFLKQNSRYPLLSSASAKKPLIIQFTVRSTGKTDQIKVVRGDNPKLNEEAIRLIKLMPDWIPARYKGRSIESYYTLPMRFAEIKEN
jgi:agarase